MILGENHVFLFENIVLNAGKNTFCVRHGNHKDIAEFWQVQEGTENYACPDGRNGGLVRNWFADDIELDENIQPLDFPEGYYSIKDTIESILDYPKGETILKKYIAPMFDHQMFEMLKGFTIERMAGFNPEAFIDILLYNINLALNKVKKPE